MAGSSILHGVGTARPLDYVRWGGLLAGLMVCVLGQVEQLYWPSGPPRPWWALQWVCYIAAGFLFLRNTRDFPARRPASERLLTVQILLSVPLALSYQILAALSIPLVCPPGRRLGKLVMTLASVPASAAFYLWLQRDRLLKAAETRDITTELIVQVSLSIAETWAWCGLAYGAALLIERMDQDRRRLTAINAELLSSRVMLAESSRLSERLEISRELHDSLGHHLTTLNLELEIASHSAASEKDGQIRKAQFLARLLLADLRDAVSSWRSDTATALPEALRCLAAGVTGIDIAVEVADDLPPIDAARAHALLRCCQEAVTNTLRHAAASQVRIVLRPADGGVELEVRDNGVGCAALSAGNGLRGISERAAELGGSAEFSSTSGSGFLVRVRMPLAGTNS